MKKTISIFLLLYLGFNLTTFNAQVKSRVFLRNGIYLNLTGSVNIVIDNNATNAITLIGTGGNIVSENEFNVIKWNIKNTNGNFRVPFTTNSGVKIPIIVNKTSTGSGSNGAIIFSTYKATSANNAPFPSDVTNMNFNASIDNSLFVVDRFWRVDANSYTIKPNVIINFGFDGSTSELGSPNTISKSNLKAQRFNSTLNSWETPTKLYGVVNTTLNTVSGVTVTPSDFFKSWTLIDNIYTLPIELVSFDGSCSSDENKLEWITVSESNNDFFTVEKSNNGIDFFSIAIIPGAGNSNVKLLYSYNDNDNEDVFYYRLKQTDYDGSYTNSKIITIEPCFNKNNFDIYSQGGNTLTVYVNSDENENYTLTIYNILSQIIFTKQISTSIGINRMKIELDNIDNSMYLASLKKQNNNEIIKKIIVSR